MASMAKRKKVYQVLGDAEEDDYEEEALEEEHSKEHEFCLTVHDVSPETLPPDVWEAACASPDEGRAVLQAFHELHTTRTLCSQRLQTVRESRALFSSKASKATLLPPLHTSNTPKLSPLPTKKAITISSHIKATTEERKLARYEQHANAWAEAVADLADRTQRMETDLAMQRGPEYRAKVELMEAISRALPVQDRGDGSSVWAMSLRNAWERIVPMGGLLSGLFCTMRDYPSDDALDPKQRRKLQNKLVKIGRPFEEGPKGTGGLEKALASTHGLETPALGRSLTSRGRDWAHSQVLQDRLKQHGPALTKNLGHQPDMGSLKLQGQSVIDLAMEAARMPVTLQEVQAHIMEVNPEAYKELQAAWEAVTARKAAEEQAQQAEELAALRAAQAADAAAQGIAKPGPRVRVSMQGVSMCTGANGKDRARFELVHEGTAALYYHWQRKPSLPHPLSASARAPKLSSPFCLARASGVLLPNETHTVEVEFVPQQPGMFHEVWQLITTPQLLPPSPPHSTNPQNSSTQGEQPPSSQHQSHQPTLQDRQHEDFHNQPEGVSISHHLQGAPHGVPEGTIPSVSVRGVATVEDQELLPRRALEARLSEAEKEAKVRQALEHILRCVDAPPPAPEPEPPLEAAQALAWDSAQCDRWPPLYYPGPEVYAHLESAYTEARSEVYRLRAEASEAAEAAAVKSKKAGKGGKGGKDKDVPQTPEAPLPEFPEQWNGGLRQLYSVLDELEGMHLSHKAQLAEAQEAGSGTTSKAAAAAAAEAAAAAAQAADAAVAHVQELRRLAAGLELSTQALSVPSDARTLMRHAMRAALGRVADAVDAKLSSVHAEYEKKLAEQESEGATVLPGKGVGPQWLADKCRAGAKAQTRSLVPWLFEEVAREKGAIGDWLEARIADLDARIAVVEEGFADPGPLNPVDAALEAATHAARAQAEKAQAALEEPPKEVSPLEAETSEPAPGPPEMSRSASGRAKGMRLTKTSSKRHDPARQLASMDSQRSTPSPTPPPMPTPLQAAAAAAVAAAIAAGGAPPNTVSSGAAAAVRARGVDGAVSAPEIGEVSPTGEGEGGGGATAGAGESTTAAGGAGRVQGEVVGEAAGGVQGCFGADADAEAGGDGDVQHAQHAEQRAAKDSALRRARVEDVAQQRAMLEGLYWLKFMRLRDWSRRGIPARSGIR